MNPAAKEIRSLAPAATCDKRRELRYKADGLASVRLTENKHGPWLEVNLVDVSESGFRVAHADTSFGAGEVVDFAHPYAAGTARVMWNRILNGRVETGCMILTRA